MGCDIHAHVEYRDDDGTWLAYQTELRRDNQIPPFLSPVYTVSQEFGVERNYTLFARLAGACADETDDPPIAEPRDCSAGVRAAYDNDVVGIGLHHQTWLTFREILDADWGEWTDLENPQTRFAAVCGHGSPQWFLDQVRHGIPTGLTTDLERLRLVVWFDN